MKLLAMSEQYQARLSDGDYAVTGTAEPRYMTVAEALAYAAEIEASFEKEAARNAIHVRCVG